MGQHVLSSSFEKFRNLFKSKELEEIQETTMSVYEKNWWRTCGGCCGRYFLQKGTRG